MQANIKKDVAMIDEVMDHLRSLKTTWEEAIRISNKEKDHPEDDASTPLRA